jgi:hypothetical protein
MSILELFRYQNDSFQSDIFSSDIGITDVDVGCRISPTLRAMSMPTYDDEGSTVFVPQWKDEDPPALRWHDEGSIQRIGIKIEANANLSVVGIATY